MPYPMRDGTVDADMPQSDKYQQRAVFHSICYTSTYQTTSNDSKGKLVETKDSFGDRRCVVVERIDGQSGQPKSGRVAQKSVDLDKISITLLVVV